MKPTPKILALLGSSLLAATATLHAADYWWNQNGTDVGWGGAGTWSTSSAVFSTINSDTAAAGTATTTTSDTLTIGTSTVPFVGGATITVDSTQNIGAINFTSTSGGTSTISGGTLNFAATGAITNSGTQQLVVGGVITGAATALDLYASTGQITFSASGASNFGVLNVRTGRVAVNNQNSFGGTGTGKNTVVFDGASLLLNSTSGSFTEAMTISGAGFGTNPGALMAGNNAGQNPTLSGAITLGASSRIGVVTGSGANSLSLSGAIALGANTLTLNPTGSNTTINVSNAISGTGGSITKTGAGTLNLTANNTYTGDTTISQGVLVIGNGGFTGRLGNNSDTFIDSGAELRIDIATDASNFGYSYSGELSGSGTVTVPSSRRFNFQTNNQTASGDLAFVVNGTLAINTGSGVTSVHLGELSGSGNIQRAGTAPTEPPLTTLTIGGKNTDSTYSGNIANVAEFAIDKVGSGSLALEGSYGHGGGTTVSAGTLLINGFLTSSANTVTVGTNGTLGGTGSIAGATTIEGSLNPGTSAGVLSFGSNLSLTSDATTTMEILGINRGSDYDGVNIGGTLGLGGELILDLGSIFDPGTHVFDLFAVSGSTSDDFDSVALKGAYGNHSLAFSGGVWSTTSNNGNETWSFSQSTGDLTLTVIPEPRAALLGGIGLLLLLRRHRG